LLRLIDRYAIFFYVLFSCFTTDYLRFRFILLLIFVLSLLVFKLSFILPARLLPVWLRVLLVRILIL
jgi:hypothetical protein